MRAPSLFNWAADIKQGFPFLFCNCICNCIKEAPHHHGAGLRLLIKRFGGKGSVRGNRQGSPLRNNHPPAGVKSGEKRMIFSTFVQLGENDRCRPDFFAKLSPAPSRCRACR